ncbi:TRAP transporter small permease subunit [Salipiger sp.]|uniref:TRAP transporter small permease subunit n=1 Tax=Salipiger sp. TaxID=2078585 RepID=UPI003A981EC2
MPGPLARAALTAETVTRAIETGAMVLSALSVVAITLIVCTEVLLRTGFGISTLISAEFAGYLLAANVYLGLAWTFRDGGFIRVELLHGRLHGRGLAAVNLVLAAVACLVFAIYTRYLAGFVSQSYHAGTTSIFITRTPLWIPQLVMPVGAALMTWTFFTTTLRAACGLVDPALIEEAAPADAAEAGAL